MPAPMSSLPADQRRDVVLHAGMGRTGTTSLQTWLARNRERLADRGILYPESPGPRRHVRLGLAAQPVDQGPGGSVDWRRQPVRSPRQLRPLLEEGLVAELQGAPSPRVVLSDEALFGTGDEGLRYLSGLLAGVASSVRVVVYLRRQDEHVSSRYQQTVKLAGEVRRMSEWLDDHDFGRKYDYHARLRGWQRLVAPDALVVRAFERAQLVDGSLHSDFLDAAGLGIGTADLEPAPDRNESLDAESVEFLRLHNLLCREHPDTVPLLPRHRRIVKRLLAASDGPTLSLSADDLERFMARHEESNRAVAGEFAPGAPEALFGPRAASRSRTSVQRLDPARVDHFLALAGMPEAAHAHLRALAEREAGRV